MRGWRPSPTPAVDEPRPPSLAAQLADTQSTVPLLPRGGAMKFHYTSGSRPLQGYTIKRGIGIGGFGEVYFATSDAGKEVGVENAFNAIWISSSAACGSV